MAKRVTIRDVAKYAGVSKSTVSFVLNADRSPVSISEKTRQKVLKAIQDVNYHPNAAARALSTKNTGHIGLMLSDSTTGAWSNEYISRALCGVEEVCRNMGYGLNVTLYNLTNVDSFIFPTRVSQRSVDGLILTGHVKAGVVKRFNEFGIPCVCIGDDLETAEQIFTLSADVFGGRFSAVKYAVNKGHTKISILADPVRRAREVAQTVIDKANQQMKGVEVSLFDIETQWGDHRDANAIVEKYVSLPKDQRPSVIIANDQVVVSVVKELRKYGLRCPDDLSLISSCDSNLCRFMDPSITAINFDLYEIGKLAAKMLIEHLKSGTSISPDLSRADFPCELVVRDSCKKV